MGKRNLERKIEHQKQIETMDTEYKSDVMRIVDITLIVLIAFAAIYLVTGLIKGDINLFGKKNNKDEQQSVTIQYEEILGGESFSQKEDDYFVLFSDYEDSESSIYGGLISKYKTKSGAVPVYKVDLSKGYNNIYLTGDETNKHPNNASELKIKGATLIHFKNKQVAEYIEGKDNIVTYFNNLMN